MRGRLLLTLAIGATLLSPPVSAESLSEELADLRFEEFIFTFTWNTETDRANVIVVGKDLVLEGEAASELRHCIDGDDCAISALEPAARDAQTDGEVTEEEVESFALYVRAGLATMDQMKKILSDIRQIIKIDNLGPTSITFTNLEIIDAEGDVGSRDPVRFTVTITGSFGTVAPADKHTVWVQRREANFTIADRFIVQAGKGWRINEDSIQPNEARALFDDGKFSGAQDQFESSKALEFSLEKHKKSPGWGLFGSLAALGVAALLTTLLVVQRRRKL